MNALTGYGLGHIGQIAGRIVNVMVVKVVVQSIAFVWMISRIVGIVRVAIWGCVFLIAILMHAIAAVMDRVFTNVELMNPVVTAPASILQRIIAVMEQFILGLVMMIGIAPTMPTGTAMRPACLIRPITRNCSSAQMRCPIRTHRYSQTDVRVLFHQRIIRLDTYAGKNRVSWRHVMHTTNATRTAMAAIGRLMIKQRVMQAFPGTFI